MVLKFCERILFISQKIGTYLGLKTTEERGSGSIKRPIRIWEAQNVTDPVFPEQRPVII
jgi:hypothetical protein